jgi:hypothetical protein
MGVFRTNSLVPKEFWRPSGLPYAKAPLCGNPLRGVTLIHNSISKQIIAALVLLIWIGAPYVKAQSADRSPGVASNREVFLRTELYFGTARRDIDPVSDGEWRDFLEFVITKRFPEGLTVIAAEGQYRDDSGIVNKEKTYVLILLYPLKDWKRRNESIEFIREAYKKAFKQQSVLRVDFGLPVKVSF